MYYMLKKYHSTKTKNVNLCQIFSDERENDNSSTIFFLQNANIHETRTCDNGYRIVRRGEI